MNKLLYWFPRILAILFILFLAIFSLDVFDGQSSFLQIIVGLFMHNIPVIILAILLWLAWKREWIGTIAFTLGGIVYIGFILWNVFSNKFEWYYLAWSLQIALPAFIIAYLFYLNWKTRKKRK